MVRLSDLRSVPKSWCHPSIFPSSGPRLRAGRVLERWLLEWQGHLGKPLADPRLAARGEVSVGRSSLSDDVFQHHGQQQTLKNLGMDFLSMPREAATTPRIHIKGVGNGNAIKHQHWDGLWVRLVKPQSLSISRGDAPGGDSHCSLCGPLRWFDQQREGQWRILYEQMPKELASVLLSIRPSLKDGSAPQISHLFPQPSFLFLINYCIY